MEPLTLKDLDQKGNDAAMETAYILNKREHWFALRRFGDPGEWFDLNSCMEKPFHYTFADLRFHIGDAVKEGYTVFRVRGPFPEAALEKDYKKLLEAIQGCGRPGQGYSLYAGGGNTLGGGGGGSAPTSGAAEGGGAPVSLGAAEGTGLGAIGLAGWAGLELG
jgi:hypothetical protein